MRMKQIPSLLLDIGAVKFSVRQPFTLTSGLKSPIYCDNRLLFAHPAAREIVIAAFVQKVRSLKKVDVIAGTAVSGIPWAAWVADRLKLPFVFVRKEVKTHGTMKAIEGELPPKKRVVVIEDHLSTAGSALGTVERLRKEGKSTVEDVAAITTAQLPIAQESAEEVGVSLHSLCTFTDLLNEARAQDLISEMEFRSVADYMHDPKGWEAP